MTEQPTTAVADLLRAEADRQGLSGAALARRCGMSQSGVAKLLRGESAATVGSLLLLLAALGRDLQWLHRQGIRPQSLTKEVDGI